MDFPGKGIANRWATTEKVLFLASVNSGIQRSPHLRIVMPMQNMYGKTVLRNPETRLISRGMESEFYK